MGGSSSNPVTRRSSNNATVNILAMIWAFSLGMSDPTLWEDIDVGRR